MNIARISAAIETDAADAYARLIAGFTMMDALRADHRTLCAAPDVDMPAIVQSRWQMAISGRARLEVLTDIVFPILETHCTGHDLIAVRALRASNAAYRQRISDFVTRWPARTISADWPRYLHEMTALGRVMAHRMAMERRILAPALLQIAGIPAPHEPIGPRIVHGQTAR